MTPDTTKPIEAEGNIWEIDFDARYFILSGRDHKPFLKVYWRAGALEDKAREQRPGYYEAVVVEPEELDTAGGLKEAWLQSFLFRQRGDFPKIPKTGKGSNYPQRNEKLIAAESLLRSYTELWKMTNTPDQVSFEDARREIKAAVDEDLPWLMGKGGM
jgi:hypothetical protein